MTYSVHMSPNVTPNRTPDIGFTFHAARTGLGISGRAIADRAGISHTTLSRWERGLANIGETRYQHLRAALIAYLAREWKP